MGRPRDRDEARSAFLNIRVTPTLKARLELYAKQRGRKLSQECEDRLLESIDATETRGTPETEALLADIEQHIVELETATGEQWHKDARAWAAVRQMLYYGPIMVAAPKLKDDDDELLAALKDGLENALARRPLHERLKILDLPEAVTCEVLSPQDGMGQRGKLRGEIETLGLPTGIKSAALETVAEIEALDAESADIKKRQDAVIEPIARGIQDGRALLPEPSPRALALSFALSRLENEERFAFYDKIMPSLIAATISPPKLPLPSSLGGLLAGAGRGASDVQSLRDALTKRFLGPLAKGDDDSA